MHSPLTSLLATGVPVAAWAIGYRAVDRLMPGFRESWIARASLGLGLGVALLTPGLVVLAHTGLFSVQWLGVIGWIVAGATIAVAPRGGRVARPPVAEAIVLAAACVYAIVAATGRDETIGGGRDQQVYAQFAVALAETGSLERWIGAADAADRVLLADVGRIHVPGTVLGRNGIDAPFTPYLPAGWTVWLALAFAIGDFVGLYAANAVVFAWAAVLYYMLVRALVGRTLAAGATLALLALPSSLWMGGISLSEPLAMALLLCVPLLAIRGLERSRWAIAAVMLAAGLVRLDSTVVLPAIVAAALLSALARATPRSIAASRRVASAAALAFVAVVAFYAVFNGPYLASHLAYVGMAGASLFATCVATALPRSPIAQPLRAAIRSRTVGAVTGFVLILLFGYAALLRPSSEPFSLIASQTWLNGTRDYREDALRNLAVYVSWPTLIAALGGVVLMLSRGWLARGRGARPLLLILALAPGVLFLWHPLVSPDHPWAVRRFVPTVIPYTLMCAAVFVGHLLRRWGPAAQPAGALALVVGSILALAAYPWSTLLFQDNRGVTQQLAAVSKQLPDEVVVSIGLHEAVASALLLGFGKPVINLDQWSVTPAVEHWVASKAALGRPAWLLHGPELTPAQALHAGNLEFQFSREFVKPANEAPAREVARQDLTLSQTALAPPSLDSPMPMFGSDRMWGSREKGFYNTEIASFGSFRYTTGNALLTLPAGVLDDANVLKVDLFTYADSAERREVEIDIAGHLAWRGKVAGGVSTVQVRIPDDLPSEGVSLAIRSETVSPAKLGSPDRRDPLGVGLIGIRALRQEELAEAPAVLAGLRSSLRLLGGRASPLEFRPGGEASVLLEVRNSGHAYWPVIREIGGPQGAVQIAVRWHRVGEASFVADHRIPMSIRLHPGDRLRLRAVLKALGSGGEALPTGDYEIRLGMVLEGVALFADDGDAVLVLPAVVSR